MPVSPKPPSVAKATSLSDAQVVRVSKPIGRDRSAQRAAHSSAAALVPLFVAAVFYIAGIALTRDSYLPPGPLLLSLVAVVAIAVTAVFKAPRIAWVPMLALWIGLGAWSAEMEPQPIADARLADAVSDGLLRTVEGTVVNAEPLSKESTQDYDSDSYESLEQPAVLNAPMTQSRMRQQVDLEIQAAEVLTDTESSMQPIPHGAVNRVRLELYWPAGAEAAELSCGETIRATVRLVSSNVFLDPGVWNRAAYLSMQQVAATAAIDATRRDNGMPRLERLQAGRLSLPCLLNKVRQTVDRRLQALPEMSQGLPSWLRVSPADTAMLSALLTGDRTTLTRGIRSGFERTGSFHLIVVSGLHLAIVAGACFLMARRLRMGRVAATFATIAAAFLYAVFTGFGVPVQRSFWMVTLYLLGRLLYRDRSPLNVVGFAALCLAAASPQSIFDASFQMTLLAVTAIAGIAAPLLQFSVGSRLRALRNLRLVSMDAKLPRRIAGFRVLVRLIAEEIAFAWSPWAGWRLLPRILGLTLRAAELLCVSAIVELALALPMAIYFHRITVYALPVNLCLLPLLSILLPVAMVLLIVIAIWPAAALMPAAACVALLHAGIFVVQTLGHWASADLRLPGPTTGRTLLAFVLFLLAVWLVLLSCRSPRGYLRWIGVTALASMAALAILPRPLEHPRGALLFEAIDVGQGDSLLLITPDGHTLLVDGGGLGLSFLPGARHASSAFDTGEDLVSPTLWARGIRRLDAVALSHAHHDHMGGLPAVLRNFHPRELWIGENPPVSAYADLLQTAHDAGTEVRHLTASEGFSFGDAEVRVLGPPAGYKPGSEPSNQDSLVLRLSYGAESILLSGDAENAEEQAILSSFDPASTVLKVGHHGSTTSTRPAFLQAVHPLWAVISCGRRNRFGHPRQEVLEALQQAHVRTFRTDSGGATCLTLSRQAVAIEPNCGQ